MNIKNIKADASLMYAIQQTTKQSSADILSYFYKIICELNDASKTSTARVPKRNIKSLYPNTGIPYQCEIYRGGWGTESKTEIHVFITFPKNQMSIQNLETLMKDIAENSLLGEEIPQVPEFKAPIFKAPRGKRHLIND